MTCIKMGSDESHFNVSLIVRDKVTRPCPQTTIFEKKGEPKQYRTKVLPLTSLPPDRKAKPGSPFHVSQCPPPCKPLDQSHPPPPLPSQSPPPPPLPREPVRRPLAVIALRGTSAPIRSVVVCARHCLDFVPHTYRALKWTLSWLCPSHLPCIKMDTVLTLSLTLTVH